MVGGLLGRWGWKPDLVGHFAEDRDAHFGVLSDLRVDPVTRGRRSGYSSVGVVHHQLEGVDKDQDGQFDSNPDAPHGLGATKCKGLHRRAGINQRS